MGFGQQILLKRREKDVKQDELAAEMGVSIPSLVSHEREDWETTAADYERASAAIDRVASRKSEAPVANGAAA